MRGLPFAGAGIAGTIFVGAFLLFQVQPMIAKIILPWFGGVPAVWTSCMLFFQLLLLVGYAYAHFLAETVRPKVQAVVHGLLVVLALTLVNIYPDASWKPAGDVEPVSSILLLLAVHVGLPYFLLAATSPLMQHWFSLACPDRSPYRLYALSNLGSLLALLSYPFLFERMFTSPRQTELWAYGFYLFAAVTVYCALLLTGRAAIAQEVEDKSAIEAGEKPGWHRWLLWFALAACGSTMLLALTNHICHDISVVPFLWIAPLVVYLLSFILCFESSRFYSSPKYILVYLGFCALLCDREMASILVGPWTAVVMTIGGSLALLFISCMVCHGELVRLKPAPRYLTSFYLMISAGGAFGGVFVSVVAPNIFSSFLEFPLGLSAICFLLLLIAYYDKSEVFSFLNSKLRWAAATLIMFSLSLFLMKSLALGGSKPLLQERNFYGVVRVREADKDDPLNHRLSQSNGNVTHGVQYTHEDKQLTPLSYYSKNSGAALAFELFPKETPRTAGLIGLGVGTLAAFGRTGDEFLFYEINPIIISQAYEVFHYLPRSPAQIRVVSGDGRLSLEREDTRKFDILAIDVFSGDAIPVHLLTKEAFELYLDRLQPDGAIVINITNAYLDLFPVVKKLIEHFGLDMVEVYDDLGKDEEEEKEKKKKEKDKDDDDPYYRSVWVVLSKNQDYLERIRAVGVRGAKRKQEREVRLWTDNYSNIFDILK